MRRTRRGGQVGRRYTPCLLGWRGAMAVLGLLVLAGSAAAQLFATEVRVTETFAPGRVDWTEGVVLSRDSATSSVRRGAAVTAMQEATQVARQGLLRVFTQVRF